MLDHAFGRDGAVPQFPGTLQLMQVFGADVVEVLLQGFQQVHAPQQQRLVGHVVVADAPGILIHDLLQALQAVDRQDVARGDGAPDNLVAPDLVVLQRLVYRGFEIIVLLVGNPDVILAVVADEPDRGLRRQPAFGEGAGGKGVGRAAKGVPGAKEAFHRHHPVVTPVVLVRGDVLRPARPCPGAGRMGTHDVGLRGGQFRIGVLGIDILGCPDHGLSHGHAEEVFPADDLLVGVLEGFLGHHVDRTPARLHLLDECVVPEAGRGRVMVNVLAHQVLGVVVPLGLVLLAVGVLGVGFQVQEVGAHGTVAVLETAQHDTVLHLGHLRAGQDRQGIGGGGAPGRVPGTAHALAHGTRLEDMGGAAGAHDHRLGAEHVEITRTDIESHGPAYTVGAALVHQQVGHHDAVVDLVRGLARGLRHDGLVALAMDHDLPLAFTLVAAGFRIPHQRQAPFLELVHGGVHMPRHVVGEVLAHHAHEVVARVPDMVLGLVFVPLHAHVAVDGVESLRHRAGSVYVRLFGHDNLEVASPVARLVGRTGAAHSAANDQDIAILEYGFVCHQ